MDALKQARVVFVAITLAIMALVVSSPAKAGDGRDVLEIMPANTAFMLVLDFERLRDTYIFREIDAALHIHPTIGEGYDRFIAHTGFDLAKDIETLVVVLGEDFPQPGNYLIVGQGRFQRDLFVEFAREAGGSVTEVSYREHTIYEVDLDGGMVFHEDLFFTGNLSALKAAIDNIDGDGENITSNTTMMGLIDGVETNSSMWVVSHLSEARRAEFVTNYPLIAELSSLTVFANLKDELDCQLKITMVSERGAKSVEKVLSDLTLLAAAEPHLQAMGLESMIRSIQPLRTGNQLSITISLDSTQVETAAQSLSSIVTQARKLFVP